ncbi:MAG: alpha/beta hydrolase-fold protein [Chitinophagaceae bacterium]|jgi:enterochelin esterase-like enzyme|nr:alpha/beta hydrolase-fold protein [Chitinophagaceae bacterium]
MSYQATVAAEQELLQYSVESFTFDSAFLDRTVKLDAYLPIQHHPAHGMSLLLVNDGQDLPKMPFGPLLDQLLHQEHIKPVLVVGIHCNEDRRLEYGTADILDFMNRGARAKYHRKFVLRELIPLIRQRFHPFSFTDISYAGFSLGGLSALDVAWKHPEVFTRVGVFSGSLWWRLRDLNDGYEEETDRIMHKLIREGNYAPHMKFFFETGTQDEKMDRNHNGIIDSIDDTLDLIRELEQKGYCRKHDIHYLELPDGRHDVPTWARAFPDFLKWGWGR